jgi:hypothetical protein
MLYRTGSTRISFEEILSQEIRVLSAALEKKGLLMSQRYTIIKPS